MTEKLKHICTKEGCDVETSEKCSEGHGNLTECPHYSSEQNIESSKTHDAEVVTLSPNFIELASGLDLTVNETIPITTKSLTMLIVLAGSVGSGKTTLLASLYGMFQAKPFAGYIFAGSRTLLGFEKRCHLARIASYRVESDTERTKSGHDDKFLHLRVRKKDLQSASQDILFSDISGETFRLVRDSDDECKRFRIIKRADHFGLMIDGEKLSNIETRQSTFQDAKILVRRCIQNGMLGSSSFINIIFTKYDIYKENKEVTDNFIPYIKEYFINTYKQQVSKLEFFEVAARPQAGSDVPNGYGLDRLFLNWTNESPFFSKSQENYRPHLSQSREFDKFLEKYFGERSS